MRKVCKKYYQGVVYAVGADKKLKITVWKVNETKGKKKKLANYLRFIKKDFYKHYCWPGDKVYFTIKKKRKLEK